MQQLVDYIRASATTHPRAAIDQQLRAAGHDERTIDQAWTYAHAGSIPAVDVATASGPVGTSSFVGHGPRHRHDPRLVVAIAVVATIAVGVGVLQLTRPDVRAIPASELQDNAVMQELAEDTGIAAGALQDGVAMVDGALDASKLPEGWKPLEDGMWGDTVSRNNVSVGSLPSEGLDAMAAAGATSKVYDDLSTASVVEGPRAARLNGSDAVRIRVEMTMGDLTVDQRQWFVEVGDEISVVTATVARSSSAADADEVDDALGLVRLGG